MPKPRSNDLVCCRHFVWRLGRRGGMWQADGRSNDKNAGRHSLGTLDRIDALRRLHELDAIVAGDLGLAPKPQVLNASRSPLLLEAGRKLYESFIQRPREVGGVRVSTQKRYRTSFDKLMTYAKKRDVNSWNEIDTPFLIAYATHLEKSNYAGTTLRKELTTVVQAQKWLTQEKHLVGVEPLRLKIKKTEGERAYCYTSEEVRTMVEYCLAKETIVWLGEVIVALACTGLRISELASLRWSDLDIPAAQLVLTDESGRSRRDHKKRRELKSGRSRRLPIHPDFATVLGRIKRTDGLVFHGPRGGRLKPDTVRNILIAEVIKPLSTQFPSPEDEQGFQDGRLHSFRHYFASTCANRCVPERVVMEWLGHQDSEMVRHYYHLHDAESRRQMQKLDLVGSAGLLLTGNDNRAAKEVEREPPHNENSSPVGNFQATE